MASLDKHTCFSHTNCSHFHLQVMRIHENEAGTVFCVHLVCTAAGQRDKANGRTIKKQIFSSFVCKLLNLHRHEVHQSNRGTHLVHHSVHLPSFLFLLLIQYRPMRAAGWYVQSHMALGLLHGFKSFAVASLCN